nr:RALF-LIKE 27 family protein [Ipomoea batatas]
MGANYRLFKCSCIAANILLLLLLPNIYTCAAGAAAQSLFSVPSSVASVRGGRGVIGEEFVMMDSETSRRLLESASNNHVSYGSLNKGPICNAKQYGSCVGDPNNPKINCNVYNRGCGGGGGQ